MRLVDAEEEELARVPHHNPWLSPEGNSIIVGLASGMETMCGQVKGGTTLVTSLPYPCDVGH